jgi:hypothetical protein
MGGNPERLAAGFRPAREGSIIEVARQLGTKIGLTSLSKPTLRGSFFFRSPVVPLPRRK